MVDKTETRIAELECELFSAKRRIQELNEIIVGNRPDKFHDSIIPGSRVMRMIECISTLESIINHIDTSSLTLETKLVKIRDAAEQVLLKNPSFTHDPS